MTETGVPAPKGAESWKANIPNIPADAIQDRGLAPYEHPLTREAALVVDAAVADSVQVTDNLPRRADGTAKMGPQGWQNQWNRPSGVRRVADTTPLPLREEDTDPAKRDQAQITEQTSVVSETQGKSEQNAEGAKETVVYQAPNRLPGSTRRVQPW